MLQSLIFISPKQFHPVIENLVCSHQPSVDLLCAESIADLMMIDNATFGRSRLISFLSDIIVPKFVLEKLQFGAINFHPGPPSYPGHAPFSFALYDGAHEHAITIHEMLEKVDSGGILAVKRFSIPKFCNHMQLIDLCISHATNLLNERITQLLSSDLFEYSTQMWGKHKTTKNEFAFMCQIPLDISKSELERRILAFGAGDGITLPYIWHDENKYFYQANSPSDQNQIITLFDKAFIKHD
jgi:methionyl-tRNA formyltransferase